MQSTQPQLLQTELDKLWEKMTYLDITAWQMKIFRGVTQEDLLQRTKYKNQGFVRSWLMLENLQPVYDLIIMHRN